jgi:Sigma-70, region 4
VIALSDELADPQQAAVLADAVGMALLVVLDRLTPAERIAFVLHDLFAVSFADIGPIVGRSPSAAKKLASRARHRVRGTAAPDDDVARCWRVAEAFLLAACGGDLGSLLAVLDPDVVRRAGRQAMPAGAVTTLRRARAVAEGTLLYFRTARHFARVTLVDGAPGIAIAPSGRLQVALRLTIEDDEIIEIDVIAEPQRRVLVGRQLGQREGPADRPRHRPHQERGPHGREPEWPGRRGQRGLGGDRWLGPARPDRRPDRAR